MVWQRSNGTAEQRKQTRFVCNAMQWNNMNYVSYSQNQIDFRFDSNQMTNFDFKNTNLIHSPFHKILITTFRFRRFVELSSFKSKEQQTRAFEGRNQRVTLLTFVENRDNKSPRTFSVSSIPIYKSTSNAHNHWSFGHVEMSKCNGDPVEKSIKSIKNSTRQQSYHNHLQRTRSDNWKIQNVIQSRSNYLTFLQWKSHAQIVSFQVFRSANGKKSNFWRQMVRDGKEQTLVRTRMYAMNKSTWLLMHARVFEPHKRV